MNSTYKCQGCHKTFEYGSTDEEAYSEFNELFPGIKKNQAALVCEDCYIKIMDHNEPNKFRYTKFIVKN